MTNTTLDALGFPQNHSMRNLTDDQQQLIWRLLSGEEISREEIDATDFPRDPEIVELEHVVQAVGVLLHVPHRVLSVPGTHEVDGSAFVNLKNAWEELIAVRPSWEIHAIKQALTFPTSTPRSRSED